MVFVFDHIQLQTWLLQLVNAAQLPKVYPQPAMFQM